MRVWATKVTSGKQVTLNNVLECYEADRVFLYLCSDLAKAMAAQRQKVAASLKPKQPIMSDLQKALAARRRKGKP